VNVRRNRRAQLNVGLALCLSAGLLAAATPAATADGTSPDYPGSSVHVSISGPEAAGHLLYIVATGSNQMTSLGTPINYGLYVILVNQKPLPGPCASSMETELDNISSDQGGGTLLVCAYSESVTDDAAWGSTTAVVSGKGSSSAREAPDNTVRPHVTRHGDSLTCARGSWSGHPTSYSFRWRLAGKTSTQKRNTLTLPAKAHGTAVCTVTARNVAGSRSASSSPFALT
jgi:hypothetical protein